MSMHKRAWWSAGLWALFAGAAQACLLNVQSAWSLPAYDPQGTSPSTSALSVRVQSAIQTGGCQARLLVEPQRDGQMFALVGPHGQSLPVDLLQDAAGTQSLALAPQESATIALAAGLSAGFEQRLQIWLRPRQGQWLLPGVYQGRVRFWLVDSQGQTRDERQVTLSVQVVARVSAQFSETGGKHSRLDFGEIQAGAKRQVHLDVQSNAPHSLSLRSAQSGALVNTRHLQERITYSVRVNGAPMKLDQSAADWAVSQSGASRHRIDVQIGEVQKVLAGEYRDDLLLTITAQ